MPGSKLVKLKTDLKSLKYGHDRQGDGNSGQPYITAPIPNRLSTSPFDDGYIRGGRALANKASKEDSLRISKFFNDKPKGPLFIARQIGLQLTNPRLETRQINLTGFGLLGGLLTVGFNAFNQLLPGPTRIYNDGKNTLAQIPVNAFGTHFERHGLSPVQDDNTKYLAVVYNNNKNGNNRLLALKKKLIRPNISSNKNIILGTINAILGAVNVFNRAIGRGTNPLLPSSPLLQPQDLIIDRYGGGPGSVYGVGLTTIRRFDVTSNGENKFIPEKGKIDYAGALGVSAQWNNSISNNVPILPGGDNDSFGQVNQTTIRYTNNVPAGANGTINSPTSRTYDDIRTATQQLKYNLNNPSTNTSFTIYRGAKDFGYFGVDPEDRSKNKQTINAFNRVDADLMTIVFQAIDPFGDVTSGYRFNFSAYIKGFKDNFDATWNEYNYAGRSESFYTYSKFKRNVSFNFDIPCFNKIQLYEKHRALGQLASTTAGAYNTNGLLGGVLLKVKVGGYLNNEYAILNNISYDIPDDSSWDLDGTGDTSKESISKRNQLAMYLKVNVSLTIIHTKLPQYKVPDIKGNEKAGFFGDLPNPIVRGNLPAQ